jgi:glucosylceramidase
MATTGARRGAAALVSLAALIPALPAATAHAVGQRVAVTWSSEDGSHKLFARPEKTLAAAPPAATDVTVNVDTGARYQTIAGQGAVLEGSSVANIARLSPSRRAQMLRQLFSPASGNAYNLVRLPIGCADMCSVEGFYTYDDMPAGQTDEDLSEFSLRKDVDVGVIAVARRARAINPGIRFYMSMWSAPAWMKDNGSLINGGRVRPQYLPVLARYQRRAIQAYEARGIPIHAITPQNEPHVVMPYPTGQWSGAELRDYVKLLGPELRRHGLATRIWIGDDNPPALRELLPPVLEDPGARRWVSGIALHDYTRDDPAVLQELRVRYGNLPLHLTERSYYGINGEWTTDGRWQEGIRRLMQLYRNGISSWTYWITFLDTRGEPNTGPLDAACCSVPFSAPPGDLDAYTTNRNHYLYGHFTRHVRRGAVVVGSDQTSTEVSNVAFRNPDRSMVVVVANGAGSPRSVAVRSSDGVLTDTLPPLSVATYRWTGGRAATDPRVGTFRIVNRAQPGHTLHATDEPYGARAWPARNLVAAPVAWREPAQRWAITSAGDGYYRITNRKLSDHVAQGTAERYRGFEDAYFAATSLNADSGAWRAHDGQLWRIQPAGAGYHRFVTKDRGTVLEATHDA